MGVGRQLFLLRHSMAYGTHIGLQHHPAHHYFIHDVVALVTVVDQVQFTHIREILVECLHQHLYQVQHAQVRLLVVHNEDEVQGGIVSIYDLGITPIGIRIGIRISSICIYIHIVTKGIRSLDNLLKYPFYDILLVLVTLQ